MRRIGTVSLAFLLMISALFGFLQVGVQNAQSPPTFVSGVVYDGAGGPWTLAGSPYIVDGIVTIPAAQVLTIEPGVEVRFNGYYEINAAGRLRALGTDTERIAITSNSPMPSVGDWLQIKVEDGGKVEFNNTDISYGDYALYMNSTSNSVITNTRVMNNDHGISLKLSSNNTIMHNNVSGNTFGIELSSSNNNTVAYNDLSFNDYHGILLVSSMDNNITSNNFFEDGIKIEGDRVQHFNSHRITDSNLVNGKPLYYHTDCNGNQISAIQTGQLIIANCTNVVVSNLQIDNTEICIEIAHSSHVNVTKNLLVGCVKGLYTFRVNESNLIGNTFFNNEIGLDVRQSSDVQVTANDVSTDLQKYMAHGIHIFESHHIAITYNRASEGGEGLYLQNSNNLTIAHNDIFSNMGEGIRSWATSDVTITDNHISDNDIGIRLFSISTGFVVYHNYFMYNFIQAMDEPANVWNDSYPSGGNYWSDWSPFCQDSFDGAPTPQTGGGGSDGICDFQYDIDPNSIDFYPLTNYSEIEFPSKPRPPYVTNLSVMGTNVNVTWTLSPSINVNAYDVYGGPSQTSIDFSAPIFSTPDEGAPAAESRAEFPFDVAGNPEYYFVIRARNNTLMESSSTSNTAGYYTTNFDGEMNTFSLPLKPFAHPSLEFLMTQIGASSVSWLDDSDDWWTHPPSQAPIAEVGKGYVLNLSVPSSFVFTGEPGAMIKYDDGWGFPAGSLVDAAVAGVDIELDWTDLGPGVHYYVLLSGIRDGFFQDSPPLYTTLNGGSPLTDSSYVDVNAALTPGEDYYMIIPCDPNLGSNGSSTYSVGVITEEFNGNEMFGLPLKPQWGDRSADWYVEKIFNSLGIVYLDEGIWKAHFKEFPEGVYDTILEFGRGYEISVCKTSEYSFVGT